MGPLQLRRNQEVHSTPSTSDTLDYILAILDPTHQIGATLVK